MFDYFIKMIVLVFVCLYSTCQQVRGWSPPAHDNKYLQYRELLSPNNLSVENINSTSISLSWLNPKNTKPYVVSEYRVRYKINNIDWMEKHTKETNVTLTNLVSGENYTIQVGSLLKRNRINTKNNHYSSPITINCVTNPEAVENVVVLPSERAITLKFPKPSGRFDFLDLLTNCSTTLNINEHGEKTWESCRTPIKREIITECKDVIVDFDNVKQIYIVQKNALKASVTCKFEIRSVSYNTYSNSTQVLGTTWPEIGTNLIISESVDESSSKITLVVNYTLPEIPVKFDSIQFNISASNNNIAASMKKNVNDTPIVKFEGLMPDEYNITVCTVSDLFAVPTHFKHNVKEQIRTAESINADDLTTFARVTRSISGGNINPLTEFIPTNVNTSSVSLSWKQQDSQGNGKLQEQLTYEITYDNKTIKTSDTFVIITGLAPYHIYTFSLTGISSPSNTKTNTINTTVQTLESPPGNFSWFNATSINPTEIFFVWDLPDQEKHGVISKFLIFFNDVTNNHILDKEKFDSGVCQGRVSRLKPNTKYLFKLSAHNKAGSNEIVLVIETPMDRPPETQASPVPMIMSATTSTIQVRFNKNFFSEQNGPILFYTVIVAEESEEPHPSVENESSLPSWNDVQSTSSMPWPPYQLLEPKQFFTSSPVVYYTIGNEKCPNSVRFCNGPLKSGTSYKVKLRAFTSETLFRDTPYSDPFSTNTSNTLLIVLSLVLVVVIIIFVGILILNAPLLKQYLYGQFSDGSDNLPLQNFSLPILVEHFKTMIINRDTMMEEFESLKRVGVNQSTEEGELDCNRPKNRFSNILPYDNSRYKLQPVDDEEGSDYINASYVPGHLSPRQYIATQGPLVGTCEEFWRLCWESSTPAIVMLTQCVELGREKCHRYWPIGLGTMQYGTITVCLKDVTHYTGWSLSELVLIRGENCRTVFHFHFTSWPDHGVPQAQDTLARFVFEFRERIKPEQNPVVVHCSAGVGRTGTFIAIDTVLQQLDKLGDAGSVDILGMVCRLREARKQMVQTVEQYECIYQTVQLVLKGLSYTPNTPLKQSEVYEQDEGVDDL